MKHRNFIYRCLFTSVIGLACLGCGDFLEEYSQDKVYAANCEDLDEVLIGSGYMESSTSSPWRFSISWEYPSQTPYYPYLYVMDDDVEELMVTTSGSTWNSPVAMLRNFYTWQQSPFVDYSTSQNELKDKSFDKLYEHIAYVNVIIGYVDQFPEDPIEDRLRIQGEGYFLRGAYYLLLANLYGMAYDPKTSNSDYSVPLKTTQYIEDLYYSRATTEEVYGQIVSDFRQASENLHGVEQPSFYRANELAARILLSRALLYRQDYEETITACDSALALGCPLWDLNTFDATSDAKTRDYILSGENPEIVFTMGSTLIDEICPPKNDYFLACAYCLSTELLTLYTEPKSRGIEDLRLSCYYKEHATASDKYVQNKAYNSHETSIDHDVFDAFVIRTPEVYLNKAEAQAMLGDVAGAAATLQPLLNARYAVGKLPQVASMGEEELVNFIRDERRREFFMEGHRWADLRRYAVTAKYPLKKSITHYVYEPNNSQGGNYAGYYILKPYGEDEGWILPIALDEIVYNNGELENPERPERENEDENFRLQ